MALSIDLVLKKAATLARKGKTVQAEALYRSVLEQFPEHKRALFGLKSLRGSTKGKGDAPGKDQVTDLMALYNQRKLDQALALGEVLTAQYPQSSDLQNFLGAVNAELANPQKAAEHYREALKINPDFADAHNNLGNSLASLFKFDEAIECYKRAVQMNPGSAKFQTNLGTALHALRRNEEAIECFEMALRFDSDYADAHINFGNVLAKLDRYDEAIGCYERALHINGSDPEIHTNLGIAYHALGRHDEANEFYTTALRFNPRFADAHNGLGVTLAFLGRHTEAVEHFMIALQINPLYADAHTNLGNSLKELDRWHDAIESYTEALRLKPEYASDYARVYSQKLHLQANLCEWASLSRDKDMIARLGIASNPVSPFAMLSLEDNPARHLKRSEHFADGLSERKALSPIPRPTNRPDRLRIGYFSADFRNHATMYLMKKLFELHDREQFVVHAYSFGSASNDEMRTHLTDTVEVFRDVRRDSDRDIAELARADCIDIAIDLKGYTENCRPGIFAYRAAPVQINYLGYPGSMGAPFIDYIVADRTIIPEDRQLHYAEKVIYLPDTYQVNDSSRQISDRPLSRTEQGLPETDFVFCCFNNSFKISPAEFDIWMRLLSEVGGSVLWLLKSNNRAEENLKQEAQARGIDPDRLIFAEKVPLPEHLARHRLADLSLDTFNYNAHTTASDALWAGLPIVTKLGEGFAARVAGSLLNAVGLPELITNTPEEYENLAVNLAQEPEKLGKIRAKLQENRKTAPLFDTALFARNLEDAYHRVYERYFDGLAPDNIRVDRNFE